jgi:hypothetical protein
MPPDTGPARMASHSRLTVQGATPRPPPVGRFRGTPTAVFAASDEMAVGTIPPQGLGLHVPRDLSVVGMDGHELGKTFGLTPLIRPPGAGCPGSPTALQLLQPKRGPEDGPAAPRPTRVPDGVRDQDQHGGAGQQSDRSGPDRPIVAVRQACAPPVSGTSMKRQYLARIRGQRQRIEPCRAGPRPLPTVMEDAHLRAVLHCRERPPAARWTTSRWSPVPGAWRTAAAASHPGCPRCWSGRRRRFQNKFSSNST